MNKLGRVMLPLITPFDEQENVNLETFKQLVNYAWDKGFLDSLVVTGTTGEFNTLSFDERVELFRAAVEVSAGRFPIIAGTGCASTRETVALTKKAAELGIGTALIVAPYYCKPTQAGIYEHYMAVANEVDIDILVYNIPIFTGVNVDPATLRKLVAASKKFIGVKDESGINPLQILDYKYATQDICPSFLLVNGDDLMLMSTIALGAVGIVSGGALLAGDHIKKAFDHFEAGRNADALEEFKVVYELASCFTKNRTHPNPMLRVAVEMVSGIQVGKARRPLDYPTPDEIEEIRAVLKARNMI